MAPPKRLYLEDLALQDGPMYIEMVLDKIFIP